MSKHTIPIYVSYSQICIFLGSLENPYNDWSEESYSQGFAWRPGSVSFGTLIEEGEHEVNIFLNEPIQALGDNCARAFKVPFGMIDGAIEIGSISDTVSFEVDFDHYILQIEFYEGNKMNSPKINISLNKGHTDFLILKADSSILEHKNFDTNAKPAT